MNERAAREAGYEFTGIYVRSFEHEEAKSRAKKLREEGNKAIVVKVPDSPLSRGGRGHGYSVYWIESPANKTVRLMKQAEQNIANAKWRIQKLEEKYKAEVDEQWENVAKYQRIINLIEEGRESEI